MQRTKVPAQSLQTLKGMVIKMKIKKSICSILSIVLILVMSMSVMAEERGASSSIDSSTFHATRSQLTQEQCDKYDDYLQTYGSLDEMEVGDTRVIYQDDESTLSVTLTESREETNARSSSRTSYKTYNFTDTNVLGSTADAFKVSLTCSWISNGASSKITNLHGEYTNNNTSKYQLSWNDSSSSDITHTLWLKASKYNTNTAYIAFSAWCHCVGSDANSPYVSFDCY